MRKTTQYTRVGSGSYDATTNTWGQGESALDDISRAVIVYLKHYEAFHDTASLDRAVAGLRTICYLQDTTGPNAGNVYDWIEPTGSPNLTVDNAPSFNWWGARALWALTEGYGVVCPGNGALGGAPRIIRDVPNGLNLGLGERSSPVSERRSSGIAAYSIHAPTLTRGLNLVYPHQ